MIYGSVCSGIEAATVAWHPLGWSPAWFAEHAPAPSAVLRHRYPEIPNRGDFTKIEAEPGSIGLLVGGTPCQSFSVAGLRGGLGDDRGNLALEFLRLAGRTRPACVVWENVPGVLSSTSHDAPDPRPPEIDLDGDDGPEDGQEVMVEDEYDADETHAFACFLAGLSELGYGWAYRVLDAQHFGVPQRRRRVFVVGYLGDWRCAAAVLFERHSLSRHPAPSPEAGSTIAASITASLGRRNGHPDGGDTKGHLIAGCLNSGGNNGGFRTEPGEHLVASSGAVPRPLTSHPGGNRTDLDTETFIAHTLRAEGFDASEDGTGRGTPLVPVGFNWNQGGQSNLGMSLSGVPPVKTKHPPAVFVGPRVRRLTPLECERLQGFPDHWTLVPFRGKPMADGPRYKCIGNSMAVPCMRWIGERIALVNSMKLQIPGSDLRA